MDVNRGADDCVPARGRILGRWNGQHSSL